MAKSELQLQIEKINPLLQASGMCEFRVVHPRDCKGQEVNARYMPSETFMQLVDNIKSDGRLESIPLCYEENGKIKIISGHHRVKAAEEIGLDEMIVMITYPETEDEIISKQLSHNSLVGIDDEQVLNELFNSIQSAELKISTGLSDAIDKINYQSINFKIGTFKEFTVAFIPEDIFEYDEKMEEIASEMSVRTETELRLAPLSAYDKFGETLRRIKKVENIKSNGAAFMRMVELATLQIKSNGVHSSKEVESSKSS